MHYLATVPRDNSNSVCYLRKGWFLSFPCLVSLKPEFDLWSTMNIKFKSSEGLNFGPHIFSEKSLLRNLKVQCAIQIVVLQLTLTYLWQR